MGKIFITGGSGMLGSYTAARAVEAGWETLATYSGHAVEIPGCRIEEVDIRDRDRGLRAVESFRPDIIIHTAAIVKPDLCEQRKSDAFAVNALGTSNVIAAAEKVGAHMIHVSTDLLFDGTQSPIKEDAVPSPVNYYGITKTAAEAAVYACHAPWGIVRTSVIYGPRKFPHLESFSDKVIESLHKGQAIDAFIDQYRPAVPVWNLADALLEIAERRLTGIYHVTCTEPSSRYQFAQKIAKVFGLDTDLIRPASMDDVPSIARRPKMLVLDVVSTTRILNTRLLSFEEGILELKRRMAGRAQT